MKQLTTKDGEPLLQFLPVENERESLTLKRHCPFIGLDQDAETVMAFPTFRNRCHRLHPAQRVRPDYQRTHCLTFAHRHCPVLLGQSTKALPPEIAVAPAKRRSIFVMLGVASVFMLLAVAFLLFEGWQWTSANGWFSDPGSAQTGQEMVSTPGVLQIDPEQPAPALLPTHILPTSESVPVEAPDSNLAPEPTPTPLSASET
jgi:hypothetical protein